MPVLAHSQVPLSRLRDVNQQPVHASGGFVLYWMTAARRPVWNFALQRAADWARELGRPLLVLEALRCGHRWASARFHRFVLDGMQANARAFARSPAFYHAYLEPAPGAGSGLIEELARGACVVVTDDWPAFFLPRMLEASASRIRVAVEAVDGNGVYPMREADREFSVAHSFRRHLHKHLPPHLLERPLANPLEGLELPRLPGLPPGIAERWASAAGIEALPIDHSVRPVERRGGAEEANSAWRRFLGGRLAAYPEARNHPDYDGGSGLSAYLHWGHISVHQIFHELAGAEGWSPERLAPQPTGRREGWWGMSGAAEAFLDELIVWREIGFNLCVRRPLEYDRYESLPDWARLTLERHAADPRPKLYTLDELAAARTEDELWNAAQRQLLREGRIHNYLRMLWGKRLLEWTASPRLALDTLIELNNRYALDGRDPCSYSGIFWVLGRYDRAWGPERPIFGTVRYMSSEATRRKLEVGAYLRRYAAE